MIKQMGEDGFKQMQTGICLKACGGCLKTRRMQILNSLLGLFWRQDISAARYLSGIHFGDVSFEVFLPKT